jgi:hypothetical protein
MSEPSSAKSWGSINYFRHRSGSAAPTKKETMSVTKDWASLTASAEQERLERVRKREIARRLEVEKLDAVHEMEKHIAMAVGVANRAGLTRQRIIESVNGFFEIESEESEDC